MDLPAHWEMRRARYLFRELRRPVRDRDEVVTCFRDGVVTLRRNRRISGFTESKEFSGYQGVRRGDLVIHQMDAFAGAVGVSDSDGMSTPVYSVCEPLSDDVNSEYFAWVIREMARTQWILALSKGIRERSTDFRFETFGAQYVPLPPRGEQDDIVRYLSHLDAQLSAFIRANQKHIELLLEMNQTFLHNAVTRGFDRTVSMVATGQPWSPEMPAHWTLTSNRSLLRRKKSVVGEDADSYRLLSLTKNGVVERDMENPEGKFPASFDSYQAVEPGEFVFCLFDVDETPRTVGLSRIDGMVTGAYDVFRSLDETASDFLYLYYLAMDNTKRLKSLYSGLRKVVPVERFLAVKTAIPPLPEREQLVNRVAEQDKRTQDAIVRLRREIELAYELRTRLVSDAVTGRMVMAGRNDFEAANTQTL